MENTKTYGYSPSDYSKFKKYANYMLFGFGLTYMFFYNGRQNMSLVLSSLAESFGTTKAAVGFISSSLFFCEIISNTIFQTRNLKVIVFRV